MTRSMPGASTRLLASKSPASTILAAIVAVVAAVAPGVNALAIGSPPAGFVVPIGSTASFTNVAFGACNSLTWGYQLNGGGNQNQFTFPGGCGSGTGPNVTIGPFATAQTLRVYLTDNHCGITYYSDGTPIDHVIVSGTNPYLLRWSDAGGFCERKNTTTNNFSGCNFCINLTISDQAIAATATNFSSTEGKPFTGTVATFTDTDTGSTSTGTVTGSGGSFSVSAGHTYSEEGSDQVTVTITDSDNASNSAAAQSTATVADGALAASAACSATFSRSFSGMTAMFVDAASPSGTVSDFSATISWGDGTSSAGTITVVSGGTYAVSGSHIYASTGMFTIITAIKDVGGKTATASCTAIGFSFAPGGGSFVIGKQNASVGSSATFWSAQWAKDNSLNGRCVPNSFKGFADNPRAPGCGLNWSADPGNSTPPSTGPLPAFMGVVVTDSVSKSGATISGDSIHIVVIQTNPGYAPNPGHAGTGKVVAVVC